MSQPNSPSPPPRTSRSQQELLNSSVLSTPSFSSTLPLPRPLSASGLARKTSQLRNKRLVSSRRLRHTQSATPSVAHSSDGSLGDFSVENYTVDLARLGNVEGGARPLGFEQAFHHTREEDPRMPPIDTRNKDINENQHGDQHDQFPSQGHDILDDEESDFMENYEIDLGGLGDKQSSLVVEDMVHPREEVPSGDEGPDDFTQNMEAWMRGGKVWKAENSRPIKEGHDPDPDPDPEPTLRESPNENAEESILEPLEACTPASSKKPSTDSDYKGGSKPEAPPLSRLNTEMLQDRAAEEVFDRISALQTEVESMRLEDEARRLAHQTLEEEHGRLRSDYASVRADYQKKFDALRSDYENLQQAHANTKEALRHENQDLTKEYNAVMEQLRSLEDQATSEQNTNLETLKGKFESAVQELESVKSQAQLENNVTKAQIEGLNRELKAVNHSSNELSSQIESMRSTHSKTLKDLETELNARKKEVSLERQESVDRANEATSLAEDNARKDEELSKLTGEIGSIRAQLRQAHEQLEETRRIVQTIEDENDRLVQQNGRHVEKIAELEAIAATTETAEAKTSPNPAPSTTDDKQAIIEEMNRQHHTALASLGADHGKEIQDLRNALLKASEGMKKREAKLMKRHQAQVDSLDRQIAALTQEQGRASTSSGTVEKELRSAIRVLSNKLEKANASVESSRLEATQARQQADEIQQENAIVNAELESRFAEAIEERENEWRRRVDLLFREREKMGKALMWGWGREELGPKSAMDREQAYRYKLSRKT